MLGRRFLGIEQEHDFVVMSKNRREELDNTHIFNKYRSRIKDIKVMDNTQCVMFNEDVDSLYGDLPF